jgi:hypothetical protein
MQETRVIQVASLLRQLTSNGLHAVITQKIRMVRVENEISKSGSVCSYVSFSVQIWAGAPYNLKFIIVFFSSLKQMLGWKTTQKYLTLHVSENSSKAACEWSSRRLTIPKMRRLDIRPGGWLPWNRPKMFLLRKWGEINIKQTKISYVRVLQKWCFM